MQKNKSKLTKSKMLNAIIATLIIITMTAGDFLILGKEVVATASDMILNAQTEDTLNKNVKFDTYFEKDNEKTHYLVCDVNGETQNMYMNLSVKEGYLKDAKIEFTDKNYVVQELIDDNQILQDATDKKLTLKQIDANSNYSIIAKITSKLENQISLADLNKESKVTFKATYVNSKGEEQIIEKDVKINVGLTQNMEIELTQNVNSYFAFQVEGEKKALVKLDVKLNSKKENNNLPVKNTVLTVEVPTLNGIEAESAKIIPKNTVMTNNQKEDSVVFSERQTEYNKENKTLSINIENEEKDGKISAGNGQDEYIVTYIYPAQAVASADIPKFISNINAKLNVYTADGEKEVNASSQVEVALTEEVGKLVSLETATDTPNINKGKMYANSRNGRKTIQN